MLSTRQVAVQETDPMILRYAQRIQSGDDRLVAAGTLPTSARAACLSKHPARR